MPTKDPVKNREYVKKSKEKKKEQIGAEEYNKYFVAIENKHRTNKKEKMGVEEYKKEQAEYMRQYRLKKKGGEKKASAYNTIGSYIIARKAREELSKRKEAKSIATSILNDIINVAPNMKVVNGELKKKRGKRVN